MDNGSFESLKRELATSYHCQDISFFRHLQYAYAYLLQSIYEDCNLLNLNERMKSFVTREGLDRKHISHVSILDERISSREGFDIDEADIIIKGYEELAKYLLDDGYVSDECLIDFNQTMTVSNRIESELSKAENLQIKVEYSGIENDSDSLPLDEDSYLNNGKSDIVENYTSQNNGSLNNDTNKHADTPKVQNRRILAIACVTFILLTSITFMLNRDPNQKQDAAVNKTQTSDINAELESNLDDTLPVSEIVAIGEGLVEQSLIEVEKPNIQSQESNAISDTINNNQPTAIIPKMPKVDNPDFDIVLESGTKDDGYGKIVYSNIGSEYKGPIKNGVPNGQGELYNINNDYYYVGNFIDGIREGYGREIFSDGMTYFGNFTNDTWGGLGIMTFPDSTEYSGNFSYINGTLKIIGTNTLPNGTKTDATFINLFAQGPGKIYNSDVSIEGNFVDNIFVGPVTITFPDKTTYVGRFSDESNGTTVISGTKYMLDGTRLDATFINFIAQGYGKLYDDNVSIEGNLVNGIFEGPVTITFKDGTILYKEYRNGQLVE